jgi:hypothetical protein
VETEDRGTEEEDDECTASGAEVEVVSGVGLPWVELVVEQEA